MKPASRGYSDEDDVTPILEPLNPYGCSKQIFDLWALRTGALRHIAGLKYFNVYGPYEDHKGDMRSLVNKSYGQVQSSGKIALFKSYRPDYRDGEKERDFIHVSDAVSVTLFFIDHPEISGLFNCGTGKARTWIDLANAVFDAIERPRNITFIDMPENIREKYQYHTCSDAAKLRRAGYTAQITSIEEGVRRYDLHGQSSAGTFSQAHAQIQYGLDAELPENFAVPLLTGRRMEHNATEGVVLPIPIYPAPMSCSA